ncbi:MAG: hypothetical protein Q8M86_05775, partial [Syntrophales bacterium]|nr:hypothetical protein [Syntrophales bacterium]
FKGNPLTGSGIIHQDIDLPKFLNDLCNHIQDIPFLGYIRLYSEGLPIEGFYFTNRFFHRDDVRHTNMSAFFGQSNGACLANTPGATGYDGDFISQFHISPFMTISCSAG